MDGFPLFAAGILEFVHEDVGQARPQAAKRFGNAIVARQNLTGQTGDEGGGNGSFALEEVGNLTGEFPRQFHKRHDRLGPAEQHAVLVPFPDDVPHGVESPFRVGRRLAFGCLVQAVVQTGFAQHGGVWRQVRRGGLPARLKGSGQMRGAGKFFFGKQVMQLLHGIAQIAGHGSQPFRNFRWMRERDGLRPHDRKKQFHDPSAQCFSGEKTALRGMEKNVPTCLLQQGVKPFVTPRLFQQAVQERRDGLIRGEYGLEVGRQIQLQRGQPDDKMQEAVDGADVESPIAAEDDPHPSPGLLARPSGGGLVRTEGGILKAPDDPFLHFGGGAVREGDGKDFRPAVRPGMDGAAPGKRTAASFRGTRKVLQEAGGQFIGLARTRRSADLPELWIV